MNRRVRKGNILQRIEALEAVSTDDSGLLPDSPEWLAFWQRQVQLYETGQEHVPLTLEGIRAYMQAIPDSFADPVETL
jgi:hypothetical protein